MGAKETAKAIVAHVEKTAKECADLLCEDLPDSLELHRDTIRKVAYDVIRQVLIDYLLHGKSLEEMRAERYRRWQ